MALRGKAPLTVCRTASQGYVQVYAGSPAPEDILPDDAQRLVEEGYLEQDADTAPAADQATFDGPPAKSAGKDVWEAYARHRGFTDAELDGLKKPELVELASTGTPGAGVVEPHEEEQDDAGEGAGS